MKKTKYEKPISLDAGYVAPVAGAGSCFPGTAASSACDFGNNPYYIPYCPNGNIATGNCESVGASAGTGCFSGTAAPGRCYPGGNTD